MEVEISTKGLKSRNVRKDKLPTNTLSSGNRIQRWANFIAGFSIEFVEQCLADRDKDLDTVIDPFLGCGTTLVGARNQGFKGVGTEAHKLFYNLASSKLSNFSSKDLDKIIEQLNVKTEKIIWSESAEKYIDKMFYKSEQEKIRFASYQLNNLDERLKPLGVNVFLKASEYACTAQTDGIYKAPDSKKKSISFEDALTKAEEVFREDIESDWYTNHWQFQPKTDTFHQSCESLHIFENESLGVCITSPPYLNNFDYAEMTRLQLYLLGWADSWGDISEKIRNKLITNTTTALKGKKTSQYQSSTKSELPTALVEKLEEIVLELRNERGLRAGKKEYDYLVFPYYQQINSVLKELYRTLKFNGVVHWVVADAALYGVHIKTHEHTKELMENIGFNNVEIKWMRKRGHRWILSKRDGAKEALGEYHIIGRKSKN
jgi:DNA modification methylase